MEKSLRQAAPNQGLRLSPVLEGKQKALVSVRFYGSMETSSETRFRHSASRVILTKETHH